MGVRCQLFLLLCGFTALAAESGRDRAHALASAGDWKTAEEQSRSYLRERPDDEDAIVLHATSLIRLSQPFDAALELEEVLKAHPGYLEAGKLYAALLIDVLDDSDAADKMLLRLAQMAPHDSQVWEGLGKLNFRHRKPAEAIGNFRQAARIDPRNPVYIAELARCFEDTDEETARSTYRQAIELNSRKSVPEASVYVSYGLFLARSGKFKEGIEYYTKALTLDPHLADALQGRAAAYEKTGDLLKAEADALQAIQESPARRDSRQLLIRIYRSENNSAKLSRQVEALQAISEEERVQSARSREMRAALNSAEESLAKHQFAQAVPHYEKVVGLSPLFYEAYFALGVCYQQTGNTIKAQAAFEKYLEYQPLSADGHAALGLLLYDVGGKERAERELERSLELNSKLVEPRNALVRIALDNHDPVKARRLFADLTDASEPETRALHAKVLFAGGQKKEAREMVELGLSQSPGNATLQELYALLLTDCGASPDCRLKAIGALRQNPSSPAYLKAVTGMLVENAPLDSSTADMVKRTQNGLPADASAQYIYAKWLYSVNRLDAALDAARGASAMAGSDAAVKSRALALEAMTDDRLGYAALADATFRQALELNRRLPSPDPKIGLAYADFLKKDSREEEAGGLVTEILHWAPANGTAHLYRATSFSHSGDREGAAIEAQLALEQPDADLKLQRAAHSLLARTYSEMGRDAEAKAHVDWLTTH